MKLVLLTATPMFNTYQEIVWILNLMNKNDKRPIVEIKDIFDLKTNEFKVDENGEEIGKELFLRKSNGYISFDIFYSSSSRSFS